MATGSDYILRASEVQIISDLDLVEVATMEYKLPAFKPLTYRGQKKLCEDLHLQLSDSTNSKRDNISVNSSKYLRIPGDQNCLFPSLSYWLTGNIDSFNLVRLKVVENMVVKLKEACIKFIVNKFPNSVINYRNVADYVVKSNMKKNSTWGTNVELFATALLLQTDIWIFSSDMGNNWMVFSGRGAKLIDTVESLPVNIAGSIYINHNGVHYEAILRVELWV